VCRLVRVRFCTVVSLLTDLSPTAVKHKPNSAFVVTAPCSLLSHVCGLVLSSVHVLVKFCISNVFYPILGRCSGLMRAISHVRRSEGLFCSPSSSLTILLGLLTPTHQAYPFAFSSNLSESASIER
jgi:hypothetical protein